MAELFRRFIIFHCQKCGIIAGKSTRKGFNVHRIERRARGRRKTGQSLYDDDILCDGVGRHAFAEYLAQTHIPVVIARFIADDIVVFAAAAKLLNEMQLFYVS